VSEKLANVLRMLFLRIPCLIISRLKHGCILDMQLLIKCPVNNNNNNNNNKSNNTDFHNGQNGGYFMWLNCLK